MQHFEDLLFLMQGCPPRRAPRPSSPHPPPKLPLPRSRFLDRRRRWWWSREDLEPYPCRAGPGCVV